MGKFSPHFNYTLFHHVALFKLHVKLRSCLSASLTTKWSLTSLPRAQRSLADPSALQTTSLFFFLFACLCCDVPDALTLNHPTETKCSPKRQQTVGQTHLTSWAMHVRVTKKNKKIHQRKTQPASLTAFSITSKKKNKKKIKSQYETTQSMNIRSQK